MKKISFNVYNEENFQKIKEENPELNVTVLMNWILENYFVKEFWSQIGLAYAYYKEGVTVYQGGDNYFEFKINTECYEISKNSVEGVKGALLVDIVELAKGAN